MGAFAAFEACGKLEKAPLPTARASNNPNLALKQGLGAIYSDEQRQETGGAQEQEPLTLADGRLNVGTHLGLLVSRYRYLSRIAEGVSSQALLVEDTFRPGHTLVVKAMHRQYTYAGQREARALRFLHAAPGVVRLLDTFMLGPHFCLVTAERLYPRFLDWIADSAQQPQQVALHALRKLAHQLLVSLAYLHQHGIVHADLKPDNVLFAQPQGSPSVAVRLVDFGGSFSLTETDTQRVCFEVQTLQYRAPEAVLGLPYGAPIDVWSVGVLLAEAALKHPLLPCRTPVEAVQMMADVLGPLPRGMLAQSPLARQAQLNIKALSEPAAAAAGAAAAGAAGAAGAGEGPAPFGRLSKPAHRRLLKADRQLADLLGRLLCYDPAQRLTAAEALFHPFFEPLLPLRSLLPSLRGICGTASPPAMPAQQAEQVQQRAQQGSNVRHPAARPAQPGMLAALLGAAGRAQLPQAQRDPRRRLLTPPGVGGAAEPRFAGQASPLQAQQLAEAAAPGSMAGSPQIHQQQQQQHPQRQQPPQPPPAQGQPLPAWAAGRDRPGGVPPQEQLPEAGTRGSGSASSSMAQLAAFQPLAQPGNATLAAAQGSTPALSPPPPQQQQRERQPPFRPPAEAAGNSSAAELVLRQRRAQQAQQAQQGSGLYYGAFSPPTSATKLPALAPPAGAALAAASSPFPAATKAAQQLAVGQRGGEPQSMPNAATSAGLPQPSSSQQEEGKLLQLLGFPPASLLPAGPLGSPQQPSPGTKRRKQAEPQHLLFPPPGGLAAQPAGVPAAPDGLRGAQPAEQKGQQQQGQLLGGGQKGSMAAAVAGPALAAAGSPARGRRPRRGAAAAAGSALPSSEAGGAGNGGLPERPGSAEAAAAAAEALAAVGTAAVGSLHEPPAAVAAPEDEAAAAATLRQLQQAEPKPAPAPKGPQQRAERAASEAPQRSVVAAGQPQRQRSQAPKQGGQQGKRPPQQQKEQRQAGATPKQPKREAERAGRAERGKPQQAQQQGRKRRPSEETGEGVSGPAAPALVKVAAENPSKRLRPSAGKGVPGPSSAAAAAAAAGARQQGSKQAAASGKGRQREASPAPLGAAPVPAAAATAGMPPAATGPSKGRPEAAAAPGGSSSRKKGGGRGGVAAAAAGGAGGAGGADGRDVKEEEGQEPRSAKRPLRDHAGQRDKPWWVV